MTREQARQEINNRISELPKAKKRAGGKDTYVCPLCNNGSGADGDGIALNPKDKTGTHYKCYKCDEYGDYLHYLRKRDSLTEWEVFERYGLTIDGASPPQTQGKEKPPIKEVQAQPAPPPVLDAPPPLPSPKPGSKPQTFTLYYSDVRGQLTNTVYPHRIDITSKEAFITAVSYDHVAAAYTGNKRSKDNFISSNCIMMDVDNSETDNPAAWVDVAAVRKVFDGVPMLIAYSRNHMKEKDGKAPRPKFHIYFPIDEVRDAKVYESIKTALLEAFPPFDDSARDAARLFFGVEAPEVERHAGDKNLLAFLHSNSEAGRKYLETTAANYISAFKGSIRASANTPAIPTGFYELDEALDGGLYEGLYVLGAISSLGKTTFILQAADQIAQQGHDVLIFSLEMSRYELMAKSISRLTLDNCNGNDSNAKTTRGILAGTKYQYYSADEKALINKSIAAYEEYAQRIFIHEGIGDIGVEQIKQEVQLHTNITGNAPVVLIDYLQILAPYDMRATDKQNTDKAVLELKRLSRDKKIPVICVSSFNRDNYTAPVNLASFKESGAIEYSSDVLMGLQLAGMDDLKQSEGKRADTIKQIESWKAANPRKAQLKILKNRNGKTGVSLYYDYSPLFNRFVEQTDNPFLQPEIKRR